MALRLLSFELLLKHGDLPLHLCILTLEGVPALGHGFQPNLQLPHLFTQVCDGLLCEFLLLVCGVKRRNRELEMENEVLRRAAAYLSQANLKLGQSPK